MDIAGIVRNAVDSAVLVDFHTHTARPNHPLYAGDLPSWIAYHYSECDFLRTKLGGQTGVAAFRSAPIEQRAQLIWRGCFLERPVPLTTTECGVAWHLGQLGIDPFREDALQQFQTYLEDTGESAYLDKLFKMAGLKWVCETNDLANPLELKYWNEMHGTDTCDPRFKPVLRLDNILAEKSIDYVRAMGYEVGGVPFSPPYLRLVRDWIQKMEPVYIALSLEGSWQYPSNDRLTELLDHAVMPALVETGLPIALMIGPRRGTNPILGDGGDSVSSSFDVRSLEEFAAKYQKTRMFITLLHEKDQYPLCVAARKFPNIIPFGSWWWLNTPQQIERITQTRLDLLGDSFIWQHSDARNLNQLPYKWHQNREALIAILTRHLQRLEESGIVLTEERVRAACERFTGAAERYLTGAE